MHFKRKTITSLVVSLWAFGLSGQALANDSDELEKMRAMMQEMNQQMHAMAEEIDALKHDTTKTNAQLADEKKSAPVIKAGDGGFGIQSSDGKNAIYLNGRVQADYHAFGKSDAQNADTWDLRRAFITLQGKIYGDYDFNVTGDFAAQSNISGLGSGTSPTKTILDQAYFGINWWSQARFRFGQFNMPFGLERNTSDILTDFTERALTEALIPSKERGAMIHGAPIAGTYYGLAISTGRGKNADNLDTQVDSPDIIGRGVVNLAKIANIDNSVIHLGGSFSHGYTSGNQASNTNNLTNYTFLVGQGNAASKTEANGITFFTPGQIQLAAGSDIERTRWGAEAAFAYGPVKFQTEYVMNNYQGISTKPGAIGAFDKDIHAWYASANWLVTGERYADAYNSDGTWGRIKPKHDFNLKEMGMGAIGLGLRYSEYDAGDFAAGAGAVAPVGSAWTNTRTSTGA